MWKLNGTFVFFILKTFYKVENKFSQNMAPPFETCMLIISYSVYGPIRLKNNVLEITPLHKK